MLTPLSHPLIPPTFTHLITSSPHHLTMNIEYALLTVPTVFFAFFFLIFAAINIVARFGILGSFGAKFQYEMDAVMGGLLGISNYSLIEGVLLLIAVVLSLDPYIRPSIPHTALHGALGLLIMGDYLLICVFYAHFAKQPIQIFAVISSFIFALLMWRVVRFVPNTDYFVLAVCAVAKTAVVVVAIFRMQSRVAVQTAVNERFRRIQKFCENHPDNVWQTGASAPVGFEE